jgi:hypothetical protein
MGAAAAVAVAPGLATAIAAPVATADSY